MKNYELGKDIQELKMRISQIEDMIGSKRATVCKCTDCESVSFQGQATTDDPALTSDHKTYEVGRIDSDECECREQTLTIFSDGTYKHIAVHHNHSARFGTDDGDTHRLSLIVRAGSEAIETFGSSRFVPKQKDRTKAVRGFSEEIKRRYNDITGFDGTLECN